MSRGCRNGPVPSPLDGVGNWLTREEWNACYFVGQEAFFREGLNCGVCEQVAVGLERLRAAGCRFRWLRAGPGDRLEPASRVPPSGEHDVSCHEVGAGSFDQIGRAREAVVWLRAHAAGVSTGWIENLLALYDRTHGAAPSPVRP